MGAGRKVETVVLQSYPSYQQAYNGNPHSARHLSKKDLAGVIFGCKHSTFKECVFKQLFGLPALHFQYVQNVTPGMPLFLFNYSDRTLHGVFEAISPGQMNINRYAWTLDGQATTPFPAQVRVKVRNQCQPLTEDQFKPILVDNYLQHEPNHLWFELDQAQTNKLISRFSVSPVIPRVSLPPTAAKWGSLFRQSVDPIAHQEVCSSGKTDSDIHQSSFSNSTGISNGKQELEVVLDRDVAKEQEDGLVSIQDKTWSSLFKSQTDSSLKKEGEDSNSEGLSTISEDEPPLMSEATCVDDARLDKSEMPCTVKGPPVLSQETGLAEEMSLEMNSDLHAVLKKLIKTVGEMKAMQSSQTQQIQTLEQELAEANSKLQKLGFQRQESGHSISTQSTGHVKETQLETHFQDLYQSIIIVGGFDGSTWLPDLYSYSPFEDLVQPLVPMSSVRSYASAVELNGDLYVLGGGYGSSWYDTVESYSLKTHQWTTCPSMKRKKGSLAGASLLGKIFAIGGGDATDCFAEVEVLDLNVGKWMPTSLMAQKRFSPAAAELNGVLYCCGGYDGQEYLRTVERFDPRAFSWMRLKNMNSRRGCHSLTVLNEKLYAIGGYDGSRMVPTVEVFEPRVGSWMISQPMKYARGYMGAVTFGDNIYTIGGMRENEEILDTVECYSEGEGWSKTGLKSVGKRCFFSAVAV